MVNYRRVVCEVAIFAAALSVLSAAPVSDNEHKLVYDQRQNGSENYRLSIDGVVIAVAPAESFISALSDIDFTDLIDLESLSDEVLKPKPPASSITPPEEPSKPDEKPDLDANPEKPQDKPVEAKPEDKPEAPTKLDDISMEPAAVVKGLKKSAVQKRQKSTNRLKQRIASIFLPFLRKRRHH